MKNIKKKKQTLKVLKEQNFEFALHNGNYLHSIYIVFTAIYIAFCCIRYDK